MFLLFCGLGCIAVLLLGISTLPKITGQYPGYKKLEVKQDQSPVEYNSTSPENQDQEALQERINEQGESYPQVEPETIDNPSPSQPQSVAGNWWDYPAEIFAVTKDPNDMTVLVNKKYRLPESYAPADLTLASSSGIRTVGQIYVRSVMISDLGRLAADSNAAGIDISLISGYRSYANQLSTYQYWVNYNGGNTAIADQISARAGHSQHQLGTAVDFSSSEIGDQIGAVFNNTAAANWLASNAANYGFVLSYPAGAETVTGYQHESWHYRYIGVANAQAFKASGQVLDQWLSAR